MLWKNVLKSLAVLLYVYYTQICLSLNYCPVLKYFLYLFITLFFFNNTIKAQTHTLNGKILTADNKPIPFASVYLENSIKGTSANQEGAFSMNVNNKKSMLICTAIGYKTEKINLDTVSNYLNITLANENYTLDSVSLNSSTYPINATNIIQNAIDKRKENEKIYKRYSVDVYVKSVQKLVRAPKKFLGKDVKRELDLDKNGQGILYLSESQSQLNFQAPSNIKEIMISSHSMGREGGFPINKASDLNVNFYQNLINWPSLSPQSFVSPIAYYARAFYNYQLLGSSIINDEQVYKIKVIPKRSFDPVFSGYIYILKNSHKIYGLDLTLNKKANINLVDSIEIKQLYVKEKNNWLPSTVNFKFHGKILGFSYEGFLSEINNNYNPNPDFPPHFFNNEILRIDSNVNNRDSTFLANHRPEPLSKDEAIKLNDYYATKNIVRSKAYMDSVDLAANHFKFIPYFLKGFKYKNQYKRTLWEFDPLGRAFYYNNVEGFGVNYGVSFNKTYGVRTFSIKPNVRYSLKTEELNADLTFNLLYDPIKRASFKVNFGSAYRDLNPNGTINSLNNSLNTILFAQNFMKLFKKEYVSVSGGRDIYNGLYFSAGIELARRYSLTNIDTFSFRDIAAKNFTSNNPFDPINNSKLFPDNTAINLSTSLVYTINQKYTTRAGAKYYELPKWPRLLLNYRRGISGILNSTSDYNFIELEVQQEKINVGLLGYSSFSVSAGKFINQRELYFPDYKHFSGNLTLVFNPGLKSFHFLDYYAYSTDNQFLEAHYEQNFTGFFVRKIPLLRKLKLDEVVGIGFLTQPIKGNYTEIYFGLHRWFLKVNYAFAFTQQGLLRQGFRISYGL